MTNNTQTADRHSAETQSRPRVEQSADSTTRLSFLSEAAFKSSTHLGITIQRAGRRLRARAAADVR
jgi:hypothetical protein